MPGIPREVAEHALDIQAGSRPVKQRLRRFDEEKRRAIGEEVQKLLAAGFVKEVSHPEWLVSQNRPIYKDTSTMAIRKRSHYHT